MSRLRRSLARAATVSTAGATLAISLASVPAGAETQPAPVTLSSAEEYAWEPQLAANADGEVAIAWSDKEDSFHSTVEVDRRSPAGIWEGPEAIPAGAYWQNDEPSVAVTAAGETLVAWAASGGERILFSSATPGQPMGPPVLVSYDPHGSGAGIYPTVGVDAAGDATVFWNDADGLRYADRPAGGSFGSVQTLTREESEENTERWQFAEGADGDEVVVGKARTSGINLWVRRAGAPFGAMQRLESGMEPGEPHVAIDDHGEAVATWWARGDPYQEVGWISVAVRAPGTSDFGPATRLLSDFDSVAPQPGMGADGRVTIAYQDVGEWAVTRSPNGTWGEPELFGKDAYTSPDYRVVFDKLGNTYVSWRDDVPIVGGEGKHAGVYVAVRPPKGRFSGVERLLSQRPAVTIFPDIAATGSSAVASWSISDALGTFVQAVTVPAKVTRTSSEEPSPPEEEAEPPPAEGGSGRSSPPAPEPSRASSAGATTATATTSWSQVTRALSPESVPGGQNPPAPPPRVAPLLLGIPRATAIASLLRAGAVGERVVAPSSGTATIRWFDSTSPQSRTSKSDQTRLLIASGKRDFARAGTSVVRVRLTHAGAVALRRARHNVLVAALATFTPVLPAADRYDGRATRLEISRRFALTR